MGQGGLAWPGGHVGRGGPVRRVAWLLVAAVAAATAAGALGLVVLPGHRAGVLDAWLLAVAAVGVLAGVRAAGRAADRTRPLTAPGPPGHERRPADLERLERELLLAGGSGMYERRIRLRLREVAAARLAARHGIDLDADPAGAAALLGPAAWALIDLDPAVPAARDAPALDLAELRAAIEAVEGT